jgi:hypothetical protein
MQRANDLRVRIEQERQSGAGHGQHPFSAELRRRVVAFIVDQRRGGVADYDIVVQLGLSQQTLYRWAGPRPVRNRQGRLRPSLVPVAITRVPAHPAPLAPPTSMVVAGPAQMRVAGLTLDELVDIWRRLAC